MKVLKRIGIAVVMLPVVLVTLFILFEIVGMCVNHISTDRQTSRLQIDLKSAVTDIDVKDISSFTGNTGNGNHVECVTMITFSSAMNGDDIISSLSEESGRAVTDRDLLPNGSIDFCMDGKKNSYFTLSVKEDGDYLCRMVTSAPFSDNFEGH